MLSEAVVKRICMARAKNYKIMLSLGSGRISMPCCSLAAHLLSRCDVLNQIDSIGAVGKDLQG